MTRNECVILLAPVWSSYKYSANMAQYVAFRIANKSGKNTRENLSMLIALILFLWAGERFVCAGGCPVKRRAFSCKQIRTRINFLRIIREYITMSCKI